MKVLPLLILALVPAVSFGQCGQAQALGYGPSLEVATLCQQALGTCAAPAQVALPTYAPPPVQFVAPPMTYAAPAVTYAAPAFAAVPSYGYGYGTVGFNRFAFSSYGAVGFRSRAVFVPTVATAPVIANGRRQVIGGGGFGFAGVGGGGRINQQRGILNLGIGGGRGGVNQQSGLVNLKLF